MLSGRAEQQKNKTKLASMAIAKVFPKWREALIVHLFNFSDDVIAPYKLSGSPIIQADCLS
tara:strand:+ start:3077 stop:3259 length:183 start_codon:yes stop_codon:yes gene_type:complete